MDNIVSGFFCKSKAKIRDVQTSDKKVFHHVFHRPRRNRSHKSPEAEFKILRMFYNIFSYFCLVLLTLRTLRTLSTLSTIVQESASSLHARTVHLFLDASLCEETALLRLYEAGDEHVKLV